MLAGDPLEMAEQIAALWEIAAEQMTALQNANALQAGFVAAFREISDRLNEIAARLASLR